MSQSLTQKVFLTPLGISKKIKSFLISLSHQEITKLREYQINYPNLNDSLKSHLIQKIHSDQIKSEPLINVLNTEIGMTGLSLIFDTNQFEKYIFDMNIFFEEILVIFTMQELIIIWDR